METTLVAPHCAGTSRICGKIKKSNVLHYICHFTSDKNNFLHSWLFFSLTWAENEHWQPLVALRPLEAVKSFISCPCDTGKQPLIPKIVSDTGKMTNEWSKVLIMYPATEEKSKSKFLANTYKEASLFVCEYQPTEERNPFFIQSIRKDFLHSHKNRWRKYWFPSLYPP